MHRKSNKTETDEYVPNNRIRQNFREKKNKLNEIELTNLLVKGSSNVYKGALGILEENGCAQEDFHKEIEKYEKKTIRDVDYNQQNTK